MKEPIAPQAVSAQLARRGIQIDDATAAAIAEQIGRIEDAVSALAAKLTYDTEPAGFISAQQRHKDDW